MAHLIDKDAIVAEIEKQKNPCERDGVYWCGRVNSYDDVLSFINTLEVKEVDLSWQDVSTLRYIMAEYRRQISNEMTRVDDEEFCKEVLRRFKHRKKIV